MSDIHRRRKNIHKKKHRKNETYKTDKRRALVKVTITIAVVVAILAVSLFIWNDYNGRIYKKNIVEAGTKVSAEDFLKNKNKKAKFKNENNEIDTAVPGEYTVSVQSGLFTYKCTLEVVDTVAPVANTVPVSIVYGEDVKPEDFIADITDATDVTVNFKEEPDYSGKAEQMITIVLTDMGGNTSEYTEVLTIEYVKNQVEIKLGDEIPDVSQFLYTQMNAEWISDISQIDTNVINNYNLNILVGEAEYEVILRILDVTPPKVTFKEQVYGFFTSEFTGEDFVDSASDETQLTYTINSEIDYTTSDSQTVDISVTDEGGNEVTGHVRLNLEKDTVPPVISGIKDLTTYMGESVSYRTGIYVTDNCDKEIDFSVDTGSVNLQAEGTYEIKYSATDKQGNTTTRTANVTVTTRTYTQEQIDMYADNVLAKTITDDMSQYDKLVAIYKWIQGNISYVNYSDKENWIKSAYEGLVNRKGDCYVFASTAKELLTRAGIKNMDIKKIPTSTSHYWNLVDIGDGWYHFDTTPRRVKLNGCYISDADLMEYSSKNDNSHNYDRTIYTDIE